MNQWVLLLNAMLIKPLQGIGTGFIGLILHWSRDNSFIWKYFNTHHVWIMSRSTGTNQAMNLVLSVQSLISWGLLIDKCCVLCMGIVIFVLQLGLTFFFPFKYIYVFNFYIFLTSFSSKSKGTIFIYFRSWLNCYHRFWKCSKMGSIWNR